MAFSGILQISVILILCSLVISEAIFDFSQSTAFKYVINLSLLLLMYSSTNKYYYGGKIKPFNKAVLITGCGSGFGYQLAKRLDSKGYQVFASVRNPECAGAKDLQQTGSSRMKVIHLDVTKEETISNAVTFVKENLGSNVLWAVINNAGAVKGFTFDFSSIQNFMDTFDVNVIGSVRVTKAFLPFLKKSKGRIVNLSSLGGRLPFVGVCAYAMSKRAIIAFTECLNLELNPWGIRVVSVEPENFGTTMTSYEYLSGHFDEVMKETDKDILSSYGESYIKQLKKYFHNFTLYSSDKISIVLDDIESAISEKNPHHTYKSRRNLLYLVITLIFEYLPQGLYEKVLSFFSSKIMGYPQLNVK